MDRGVKVDQVLGYGHAAFLSHPNPTLGVEIDQLLRYDDAACK